MHNPIEVANFFLKKAWDEARDLTPIQVIKLVYIAHGWNLAYLNRPLINETVEAWKYGPVIPSLYHEFKFFGDKPISELGTVFFKENDKFTFGPLEPDFDENEEGILNTVWENYGAMEGIILSSLTHQEGTPWYEVWHGQGGKNKLGAIIPSNLIQEHYAHFLKTTA